MRGKSMTQKSKYANLLKDTFIFALGNMGSKIIVFLLIPFYTNYLGPAEYGLADLIFTVSQVIIPFFSLVIFDSIIRFGLFRKERSQDSLIVGGLVWLVGTVLLFFLCPVLSLYRNIAEWKWHIVVYVSLNILVSIELNYLKVVDKNLLYSITCIIQTASLAGLNILFVAILHKGINGYLIAHIGSNVVVAITAFSLGHLYKELLKAKWDKSLAKDMVCYSAPLILNNLSWWVIQSSDKLMIEAMVGVAALGIYTVASKIPSLIGVFVTIFQQAWGISSIKEMDSSNDSGFYSTVFSIYSVLAFGICIMLDLIIKPFMDVYVRSMEYGATWRFVPLLMVSAVFSAIAAYCGGMYGALKKSVNNMLSTLSAAIVNIIINYIGIIAVGLWGAIIGTLVSYMILAYIRLIDIKRFVALDVKWRKIVFNSILVIVQAIIISFSSMQVGIIASILAVIFFVWVNRSEITRIQYIAMKKGK